jgi:hypothetical protein
MAHIFVGAQPKPVKSVNIILHSSVLGPEGCDLNIFIGTDKFNKTDE